MKNIRIILAGFLFFILIFSMNVNATTVDDITISPTKPLLKGSITLTATISDVDQGDAVTLYIKECDGETGLCDEPFTQEMTKSADDTYTADVDLKFKSATYLDYWFEIGGTEYKDGSYRVQYDTNNQNNDGSEDSQTPGFELLFVLLAIAFVLFIGRKRLR